MWIGVSHVNLPNLGDRLCRPDLYFDLPLASNVGWYEIPPGNCLVGGGGAIHWRLEDLGLSDRRVITWGTGWVYREFRLLPRPDGIELYGSRDWGQYDADYWVPCASCMHEAFDREYEIEREVVGFWNPDFDRPSIDIPYIENRADEHEVFAWLASAETVITSSYHGAYWASLLGRKVLLVDIYSGKFTHFHSSMQPLVVTAENWREAKPVASSGALERCREANRKFYALVRERMTEWAA